ncbi:unnamed protein product [Strongylus vulgaris]|uniref:Pre-SET domain-containing protein n=1 Tax=Strongylus vulgaris TaxID=40348 RepID=A0A3P7JC30_STRVU|nr:unnamed protein product [Strongylus vulgaris]
MAAADTRERLFRKYEPRCGTRTERSLTTFLQHFVICHDFSEVNVEESGYRVQLRLTEQSINDELEYLDLAPIYIENWTKEERAFINVKYLTRCALPVLKYREVKATNRSLRLQYPDDGADCDCKDGICTPACPCIRLMGEIRIGGGAISPKAQFCYETSNTLV